MKISAVIASYNRRGALARSLTTLFDQDVPSNQYEIVVVVDGSFDGTSEMLKSFRPRSELIVVQQENRGKTAALNRGVNAGAVRSYCSSMTTSFVTENSSPRTVPHIGTVGPRL